MHPLDPDNAPPLDGPRSDPFFDEELRTPSPEELRSMRRELKRLSARCSDLEEAQQIRHAELEDANATLEERAVLLDALAHIIRLHSELRDDVLAAVHHDALRRELLDIIAPPQPPHEDDSELVA
jgi:hypothetical protein